MKNTMVGFGCLLLMGFSWQVGAFDNDDLKKFMETKECQQCDLSGIHLSGSDLELEGVNLSGSDLSGAWLYYAYLKGTILTNTDLTETNFETAEEFDTADTTGAIFCRTIMPDGTKNNSGCSNECSKEDHDYAEVWDNYYVPEDARAFGLKIQRLVRNKDLQGMFSLVEGELQNGPRKSFVASKSFQEVFDDSWVSVVSLGEAPCSPVGWRGFMLGNGMIWYNKSKSGWNIFSIHGAVQETVEKPLLGWTINKKIVHPFCFNRPWMSGDNFEEFAEVFAIDDLGQFFKTPGRFMGNLISDFASIKPSWCSSFDGECENIALVAQLKQCSAGDFDFEDRDGSVWIKDSSEGYDVEYEYKILRELNSSRCSKLAPDIGVECKKSYLLSIGDYSGGSMGWDISYGIYGFFDLVNLGPSIVPLMFFPNKNEALNFLDEE